MLAVKVLVQEYGRNSIVDLVVAAIAVSVLVLSPTTLFILEAVVTDGKVVLIRSPASSDDVVTTLENAQVQLVMALQVLG
jgi:hypothetical protein